MPHTDICECDAVWACGSLHVLWSESVQPLFGAALGIALVSHCASQHVCIAQGRACMMRCSLDVDLSEQLRPRKRPSTAQAAASQFAPGDSLLIIPTSSSCSPLFYLQSLQNAAHKLSDVGALNYPEASSRGFHMQDPQPQKQQGGGMQSSSGYCTSAVSRAARLRGWLHLRGSPGDGSAPAGFRSGCSHATP